jgi:anti-sigma regulatory factor (Ser/Thr protein kinase)
MAGEHTSSPPYSEGWNTDSGRRDCRAGAVTGRSTAHALAAHDSDIRLTLPARPENIAVVRNVLGALAESLGLPRAVSDDMKLAVTEACTNVVRHAYEESGTIDLVVRPRGEAIEVVVADEGRGLGPSPDTQGPGLGMPLIAALTDSLEIERSPTRGSRLIMKFLRARPAPAVGFA